MAPTLSVVIPVYNEPRWIGVAVADAVTALQRSSFAQPELVIVDDGSDEQTQAVLQELETPFPLRVIHQDNKGRFLARQAGVSAARGELVLLLDARVSLHPDGLRFVADQVDADSTRLIWNGHCEIELKGNPYARFWNVLTETAFRDYYSDPRTTSYSLANFDRYPKGTGCFLAPRQALLGAIASFNSHYEDPRDANDDTLIIRTLAASQPINISPSFACLYRSRTALRPFLRHVFHRGGVFVDGYARPGSRFFAVIMAFYPLSALAIALAIRRPRLAIKILALAPLGSAGIGVGLKRDREDVKALAVLGPMWISAFAAGMYRGLLLALRTRYKRER